jgi:hypothetical protein
MPSTLWLTDRSRISDGLGFCKMARFLGYHFGPTGYGIQMKGTKIPLVRGTGLHDGLAAVLEWCRDHDDEILQGLQVPLKEGELYLPVPETVVRAGVTLAHDRYAKAVEARGYAYLAAQDDVAYTIREQQYLLEGIIWAWCIEVLPEVLRRGRIVEVEHDDTYVVGCTCGLGDGILSKADHEARDCQGIGLQQKPDFILEVRASKELEYHEFKSTGMDSSTFRDKWETMIQMFAAILDAERRIGRQIQQIYVHGLIVGRREGDYNPDTGQKDGLQRQQSVCCYGYRRLGTTPMEAPDWKALYEYYDSYDGKRRRLPTSGKNPYKKTGVWELPPEWVGEMRPAEWWARWMPSEARRKQLVVIGPLSRQELLVKGFINETIAEETRWRDVCWQLYEMAEVCGEGYWADERYQTLLNRLVPKSYECRRYGARHACSFEDVCLRREGWDRPLETGRFIPRRPHHKDELEQAIGRGLLPPEEGAGEERVDEL